MLPRGICTVFIAVAALLALPNCGARKGEAGDEVDNDEEAEAKPTVTTPDPKKEDDPLESLPPFPPSGQPKPSAQPGPGDTKRIERPSESTLVEDDAEAIGIAYDAARACAKDDSYARFPFRDCVGHTRTFHAVAAAEGADESLKSLPFRAAFEVRSRCPSISPFAGGSWRYGTSRGSLALNETTSQTIYADVGYQGAPLVITFGRDPSFLGAYLPEPCIVEVTKNYVYPNPDALAAYQLELSFTNDGPQSFSRLNALHDFLVSEALRLHAINEGVSTDLGRRAEGLKRLLAQTAPTGAAEQAAEIHFLKITDREANLGAGFDSLSSSILPSLCVDGVASNAEPAERGWNLQSSWDAFSYTASHSSALVSLLRSDYPEAQFFVEAASQSLGSFSTAASVVIDGETYRVTDALRREEEINCGDRYLSAKTLTAGVGFVFRIKFTEPLDLYLFRQSFAPQVESPLTPPPDALARLNAFLPGRAVVQVFAVQGGGSSEQLDAILTASQCATNNISACNDLVVALRAYVSGFAQTQSRDFPLPLVNGPLTEFPQLAGWLARGLESSSYPSPGGG